MKKIKLLAGVLAAFTCFTFLDTVNVKAKDTQKAVEGIKTIVSKNDNNKLAYESDFDYCINNDNTATIRGYYGDDSVVEIPDTINGYTVTKIDEGAFKNNADITGVNIPDTVDEIGKDAFLNDENLSLICINGKEVNISDTAFNVYENGKLASNEDRVIFGYSNSTAKTYAYKNKFVFNANLDDAENEATVYYDAYVQDVKWVSNLKYGDNEDVGYMSYGLADGSIGEGLRLEAFRAKVDGDENLGIEYSAHVQKKGWQSYVGNDTPAGTIGKSLRVEAIKMRLTGENKDKYDLYYRVHAQSYGWLGWAKNDEEAGTVGLSKRVEAIQVVLVKKGSAAPGSTDGALKEKEENKKKEVSVQYRTHVQSFGWQNFVENGALSGTVGKAKRLEGINIKLSNQKLKGSIEYRTHVQRIGWQNYVKDGAMSGTEGKGLRLEAIQIRLTDEMKDAYDVYYRVQIQKKGWLGWAKNDEPAGSSGLGLRLEGIQIKLVKKGDAAPKDNGNIAYVNK